MSRILRTLLLVVSLLGALLMPLAVAAPANADGAQRWECHRSPWDNSYTMSAYDMERYICTEGTQGTIKIYSTYSGAKLYSLEADLSFYARRAGRSHEWIRSNCKSYNVSYACSLYRR